MIGKALGLVETFGLVPAIEGADAAVKSSDVELNGLRFSGAGLVTIVIFGDISAVSFAVEAAERAAARLGKVCSATVIGRTGEGLEAVLDLKTYSGKPAPEAPVPDIPVSDIEMVHMEPLKMEPLQAETVVKEAYDVAAFTSMSVVKLRQLVRKLPGFTLVHKKIKNARREELLDAISQYFRNGENNQNG